MTLYTVTLTGGSAIEVYGGLTACDAYIFAMVGDGAAAYRALTEGGDDRKRLLVTATRYIDRQRWQGDANALGGTTLAWPRDDIEDEDGDAVSDADQLALVEQATFELVALLAEDSSIASAADQGQNIKSMGAGSARLEFFSPTKTTNGTAKKLPAVVDELLGDWLEGSGSAAAIIIGGISTGSESDSGFADDDTDYSYDRSEGF